MSASPHAPPFPAAHRATNRSMPTSHGLSRDPSALATRRSHTLRIAESMRRAYRRQILERFGFHVGVKAVAMGVHRDDGDEVLNPQPPHRLGNPELLQEVHSVHACNAARIELRRAANRV